MARATAAETSDRIDALQEMILEGEPNTACLTFARQPVGYLQNAGLQAAEACLESDQGRCR